MNFPERYAHLTPEQGARHTRFARARAAACLHFSLSPPSPRVLTGRALAMASLGEAKVARLEAIKNGQVRLGPSIQAHPHARLPSTPNTRAPRIPPFLL